MPTLYFKNVNSDNSWENLNNWFEDDACTIPIGTTHVTTYGPWQEDNGYKTWDITRSSDSITAEDSVFVYSPIGSGFDITGSCDIGHLVSDGYVYFHNNIYGGTFTGDFLVNNSTIFGGTFTGHQFVNNVNIHGGTFTGEYFYNNYGSIFVGTFTGDRLYNYGYIYGGTFTGDEFYNDYGYIYGGTFTGEYFYNNYGSIFGGTFTGDDLFHYGYIYGGTFTGDGLHNNGDIYGGTFTGEYFYNNSGYIYGWDSGGYGVYFYEKGNLVFDGLPPIKCKFSLEYSSIDFNPDNGIFLCRLSSDIIGSNLL